MKLCSKCRVSKPLDAFDKHKKGRGGFREQCKACCRNYFNAWVSKNRAVLQERRRTQYRLTNWERQLVKQYGFVPGEYHRRFEAQNRLCAICRQSSAHRLHVDHCHTSGMVRGLVCGDCNRGLGAFKDSTGTLKRAMVYLEIYEQQKR